MSDTESDQNDPPQKVEESIEISAPKYKLKKLIPKMENESISEKEKARRERLSLQFKERHAKQRTDKANFEKEQLDKIAKRINVKVKAKQVKEKIKQLEHESSETDEETLNEYLEFKKFKQQKSRGPPPHGVKGVKEEEVNDADDEKLIQKTKKATQVLETVNKLDQAIQSMNGGYQNPYLAFFNNKK